MPIRELEFVDISGEEQIAASETSSESFDRVEFARQALDLLKPAQTTVAICEGRARVHVQSGRQWGRRAGARWVMLSVPPLASRRAIALAIAGLATPEDGSKPYVLDVLFSAPPP
jgi:hypothetical protein